jgi:WD40 repeat protein
VDECGSGSHTGVGPREVVSGSRDGKVKIWDPRVKDPVTTIEPSSGNLDCWAVSFGNAFSAEDRCVVAGYDNGDVKLIDLRTFSIKWNKNVGNGVCGLSFDRVDIPINKLSVACLEAQLVIFDVRTFNPRTGYAGLSEKIGKSTLWGCHYLPQNRDILAVTSGDGSFRVYKYEYPLSRRVEDHEGIETGVPGSLQSLAISDTSTTQPVIGFDWHPSKKGLIASANLDQSLNSTIVTGLE